MSIPIIALQGIGLVRNEIENEFLRCSGAKDVRKLAESNEVVKDEVLNSVKGSIDLTKFLFQRLKLKEKPFYTQDPVRYEEIDLLWEEILKIEIALEKTIDVISMEKTIDVIFMEKTIDVISIEKTIDVISMEKTIDVIFM